MANSDEEGEDLTKFDSSDEDEQEPNHYVEDGFVVHENEEGGEEQEVGKKHKRIKRKSKVDDALDEDDLALIVESGGQVPKKQEGKPTHRRLKKRKHTDEEVKQRVQQALFGDIDDNSELSDDLEDERLAGDDDNESSGDDSGLDDFIVDKHDQPIPKKKKRITRAGISSSEMATAHALFGDGAYFANKGNRPRDEVWIPCGGIVC